MTLRRTVLLVTALCLPLAACTGKKREPAEKKEEKKAETKADTKAVGKADAKADAKAPPPAPKKPRFNKKRPPPPGMSPDDLKAYAEFMGDPEKGDFTLEEAFAGDESLANKDNGKLMAIFRTTMGDFECDLFEDETPLTIANFVGLARGTRASYDKKADKWEKKKFYDGVKFHRVIKNFMIQTGDPTGSGTGGPGFFIQDEIDPKLKHNKAGILSMANRGKNTGSSQFFVTVRATPHLDNKHTVFGQCKKPKVAVEISKVKVDARFDKPVEDVKIKTIEIVRKK